MTQEMGPYEAYLADMEPCLNVIRSYADDDTANQLDFHRSIEWAFMKGATAWMLMEAAAHVVGRSYCCAQESSRHDCRVMSESTHFLT